MKRIYIFGGILIILIGLAGYKNAKDQYKTFTEGKKVTVKVIYVPECVFVSNANYYFKFEFNKKIYSKRIQTTLCDSINVGDEVQLYYLEETGLFMFESESSTKEFIASFLLMVFGAGIAVYGLKQKLI